MSSSSSSDEKSFPPETHPTVWIGSNLEISGIVPLGSWLARNDLPRIRSSHPHCTVMYSSNVPGIKAIKEYPTPLKAKHIGWDVFQDSDTGGKPEETGGILVMLLKCEGLEQRHQEEMKNAGATWDYGALRPHISLEGWVKPGFLNTRVFPLYKEEIRFDGEKIKYNPKDGIIEE